MDWRKWITDRALYLVGALVVVAVLSLVWLSCERSRTSELEGRIQVSNESIKSLTEENERLTERVDQVVKESQEAINQANVRIAELQRSIEESRLRERTLNRQIAQSQAVYNQRIEDVADETDLVLAKTTEDLLSATAESKVTFRGTASGFYTDRAGAEAIKKSLLAYAQTLETLQFKDQIIAEKDGQITDLTSQQESCNVKYDSLEERLAAIEDKLLNQEKLLAEKDIKLELLEDQNNSLKRQLWITRWGGIAATVTVVIIAAVASG